MTLFFPLIQVLFFTLLPVYSDESPYAVLTYANKRYDPTKQVHASFLLNYVPEAEEQEKIKAMYKEAGYDYLDKFDK